MRGRCTPRCKEERGCKVVCGGEEKNLGQLLHPNFSPEAAVAAAVYAASGAAGSIRLKTKR